MTSRSCGLKESCTSSALGRAMRSGSVQRALRLQMELSRTRRASRSSEKTMLSLPIAVPAGQRALASSSDPSKAATKPPSISLASSACNTSGCSSARFQLLAVLGRRRAYLRLAAIACWRAGGRRHQWAPLIAA